MGNMSDKIRFWMPSVPHLLKVGKNHQFKRKIKIPYNIRFILPSFKIYLQGNKSKRNFMCKLELKVINKKITIKIKTFHIFRWCYAFGYL